MSRNEIHSNESSVLCRGSNGKPRNSTPCSGNKAVAGNPVGFMPPTILRGESWANPHSPN
jgi:hypothetical protein